MFLLHGLVQVFRTANTFTSLLLQVHQSDGFVQEHANTLNFSLSLSLSLSLCVCMLCKVMFLRESAHIRTPHSVAQHAGPTSAFPQILRCWARHTKRLRRRDGVLGRHQACTARWCMVHGDGWCGACGAGSSLEDLIGFGDVYMILPF